MISKFKIPVFLIAVFSFDPYVKAQQFCDCNVSPIYCKNRVYDPGIYYADLSYVYFSAKLENLDFAAKSRTTVIGVEPPKDVNADIDLIGLDFGWDSGVRAAIGYEGCHGIWNVELRGTYLPTTSKTNESIAPNFSGSELQYLIPLWNPSISGSGAISAEAKWDLNFGTLDLIVQQNFYATRWFSCSPYLGIRGAWIEQNFKVDYNDIFYITNNTPFAPHTGLDYQDLYRGLGFTGGADFKFPFFSCFSFIGEIAGSILYGQSKLEQSIQGFNIETTSLGEAALGPLTASVHDKINSLVANFETELGICYEDYLCSRPFNISLSYFFAIWFDQNRFTNFVNTTNSISDTPVITNYPSFLSRGGNLQLQGVALNFEICF